MADVELEPDSYLEDLPGHLVFNITSALSEDGRWYMVAKSLRNSNGDPVFRKEEILQMKRSPSPGQIIFNKLMQHDLQVQNLQYLLKENELYDVLRKVVTNVPAQLWPADSDGPHSIKLGERATITVEVDGSPYPECQWYFKDLILRGQTSPTLKIDNFSIENQGEYRCKVRQNLKGKVLELTSPTFVLKVERMPPEIVVELSDVDVEVAGELTMSCEVIGYPVPQHYRWHRNNKFIVATAGPKLKIPSVDSEVAGSYFCEVWNDLGHCRSRLAMVKVIPRHFAPSDSSRLPKLKLPKTMNFSARNKWALLMANAAYKELPSLQAPRMDIRTLAQKLRKMQYHCNLYSDLKVADFYSAIHHFSQFLRKGDYVIYYFAGHGCHRNGTDFLMAQEISFERNYMRGNIPENTVPRQDGCISATDIYNTFQRASPAVLFSVYDTCRSHSSHRQETSWFRDTYQHAQANSCTLFATSENSEAFERPNRKSLLMEHLASKVEMAVPLDTMVQQVKLSFHCEKYHLKHNQIPKVTSDLAEERSLVDPAIPHEIDLTENGVLKVWERMADLGEIIEESLRVADLDLEMSVQCCQERLSGGPPSRQDPPWIISNRIDVVITFTRGGSPFDPSEIDGGLDLEIVLTNRRKIPVIKLRGKTSPIICPVVELQSLKGNLILQLVIINKGRLHWYKMLNLGMPSASKLFRRGFS